MWNTNLYELASHKDLKPEHLFPKELLRFFMLSSRQPLLI